MVEPVRQRRQRDRPRRQPLGGRRARGRRWVRRVEHGRRRGGPAAVLVRKPREGGRRRLGRLPRGLRRHVGRDPARRRPRGAAPRTGSGADQPPGSHDHRAHLSHRYGLLHGPDASPGSRLRPGRSGHRVDARSWLRADRRGRRGDAGRRDPGRSRSRSRHPVRGRGDGSRPIPATSPSTSPSPAISGRAPPTAPGGSTRPPTSPPGWRCAPTTSSRRGPALASRR